MKAVYSFWGKPFYAGGGGYENGRHFLALLGLSVAYAHEYFSSVEMYTDAESQPWFEKLGWFDAVHSSMERLEGLSSHHWATAKLLTYAKQKEPFIHIDNDVYISKALPKSFTVSPMLAQCPEHYVDFHGNYRPQVNAIQPREVRPKYWNDTWLMTRKPIFAYNTGIFGGCDLESIKEYAWSAVDYMLKYGHEIPDVNTTIEQAYLAMYAYHEKIPVRILLQDWRDNDQAKQLGFCHYWGGTKKSRTKGRFKLDIIEDRFANEFPRVHARMGDIHSHFNIRQNEPSLL